MFDYEFSYYIGKYRRLIVTGIISIIVAIVAITITIQVRQAAERHGKIAVAVEVIPRDASVILRGGQQLTSRGTAYLAPGDYKVTVARDGYTSQTRDLRVSRDNVPYIYVGLAGKSADAKAEQARNQQDYGRLELLTVEKNRQYNTMFKSANPITGILPINDPYYSVGYKNYDDASIELIIWGTSPRSRQAALDLLRQKGYEPTDFRITYEGFTNPLEAN